MTLISSSKEAYMALPNEETLDLQSDFKLENDTKPLLHRAHNLLKPPIFILISLLISIIIAESIFLAHIHVESRKKVFSATLRDERNVERKVYAPTKYLSENETEADIAWDAILPGHGLVALEPQYAADLNLPDSMSLPGDSSKRVYVLEAYHAIHCVRILRTHYLALDNGTPWSWSREHDMHCLDALRQYIMCNPDDTLLYTYGHRDVGHGQVKMCRDWNVLREWANDKSACYFDTEVELGGQRWDVCMEGDGLPVGSLLE